MLLYCSALLSILFTDGASLLLVLMTAREASQQASRGAQERRGRLGVRYSQTHQGDSRTLLRSTLPVMVAAVDVGAVALCSWPVAPTDPTLDPPPPPPLSLLCYWLLQTREMAEVKEKAQSLMEGRKRDLLKVLAAAELPPSADALRGAVEAAVEEKQAEAKRKGAAKEQAQAEARPRPPPPCPVRLSVCLSVCVCVCVCVCICVCLSVCLSLCPYLSVCRSVSVCMSTCLPVCLSLLSARVSVCLSVFLSICLSALYACLSLSL